MFSEWMSNIRFVGFGGKVRSRRSVGIGQLRRGMERLEHRLVMAADREVFSIPIIEGSFHWSDISESHQVSDIGRMTSWIGSQLGIDLESLSEASLRGQMRAEVGNETVITFAWEGMEWDFVESDGTLEFLDREPGPFHNSVSPMDTNQDGVLAPLDVLLVIDFLNSVDMQRLPDRAPLEMIQVMVDVTGDRFVTPLDALMVINGLNSGDGDEPDDHKPLASDDFFSRTIPSGAKSYPASEIAVLRNDLGTDLRIVDVSEPGLGSVEIIDRSASGETLLRYIPGSDFRDLDFFTYTVEDASGKQSSASVWVEYVIEPGEYAPFRLNVAESVSGTVPGASIAFRDVAGNALISIDYGGSAPATVGVYLRFAANDPPYGIAIAGTLNSDIIALDATFYPAPYGGAWITGSIEQVNEILAGLWFEPSPGYSAPNGIDLNVSVFLYGELGGSVGYASDDISILVPADPLAPVAKNDAFELSRSAGITRLKVLANDVSVSGGPLRLVGVSTIPGELAPRATTHLGQTIEVDPTTNEIVYRPGAFGDYLSFAYVVSDPSGRLSQASVAVYKA